MVRQRPDRIKTKINRFWGRRVSASNLSFVDINPYLWGDYVIIMINGTFGSGKTSAANILQSLISNSMIYDPEEIGYMLRNIINEETRLEEERTDDFQDLNYGESSLLRQLMN